ncbi:MAG TPA: STAS domain-containing protein [Acidimicrobiales bacterium]|nr:STAS domain-containing protein [Acidimicrobiales bacterium]
MITANVPTEESEESDDLTIALDEAGSHTTVRVGGELDSYTSIRLRGVLDDCLRRPIKRLACNLAEVTFIDSGGLGLLVSTQRRAEAAGIMFVVTDPSPSVRRLFDMTGMSERLLGS